MWKLAVLRGFDLEAPDGRRFATRSPAARELLAVLALSGPEGASRALLASRLFGEHRNPDASLNVQLSRLRSALAALDSLPLLEAAGARIRLANADVDAFRLFEALASANPAPQSIEAALLALDGPETAGLVPGDYRSALVRGQRDELCARILSSFAAWAQSPQLERWRPRLLRAVNLIQAHLPLTRHTVERLLLVFGALGLKERILETYDRYETYLADDFGETAPKGVGKLVDDLVAALDEQHRAAGSIPAREAPVLQGREDELRRLARARGAAGVHFVSGHVGIGKTALLREVAASPEYNGQKRMWIDLAYEDEERAFVSAVSRAPDVLFIDHYTPRSAAFLSRTRHALAGAALFVAGVSPAGAEPRTTLRLRPIDTGPTDGTGPAARMFAERLAAHGGDAAISPAEAAQIVRLSGGVPSLLDMLARLTATVGAAESRGLLERLPVSGERGAAELVWNAASAATRASIAALSREGREALALLGALDLPVATALALESGILAASAVEELLASGLVSRRESGACLEIHGLSAAAVRDFGRQSVREETLRSAMRALAECVLRAPDQILGPSEPARWTAQALVNRLAPIDARLGLRLLEEVRKSLTAGARVFLDEGALSSYTRRADLDEEQFATATLSYGAYLLTQGRYEEMLAFLEAQSSDERVGRVRDESLANLLSQRALALRGVGRFNESRELYSQALARARSGGDPRTVAKVSYNIAVLNGQLGVSHEEGVAHLDEAIALMAHTPNKAAKVELLHMRAILRNGAGAGLEEVQDELRAALCHAAGFGLLAQVAWIGQNMGMVYAKHGESARAVVCEASAVYLAAELPEGLGRESLRLIRSSLATLGSSLRKLGHHAHAATCRSLIDRVGAYETCKQSEPFLQTLESRTYRGSASWDEFPVTIGEMQAQCRRYLESVVGSSPELRDFHAELGGLSLGQLGRITGGS